VIIRANGDMLPVFLVDGVVAGTWSVSQRSKSAVLRLAMLCELSPGQKEAVLDEGQALLRFYEPEGARHTVKLD
jgi:hypothetical protein